MQDFHPLTAEWFRGRFAAATATQLRAWPAIRAGRDVLVSAPTGSGKTLAAFLICLDRLVTAGLAGRLDDRVEVVYVSPLKALSNDIGRNLETPLAELEQLAFERGMPAPGIRTAVRTGDTPAWERERMVRRPPHILVTTPESLFILLTAERSRAALRNAETVIVDEIHALADDKRGSHLALTLARLDDLVRKAGKPRPQRVGLSATVRPIEAVARFLQGTIVADASERLAAAPPPDRLPRPEIASAASERPAAVPAPPGWLPRPEIASVDPREAPGGADGTPDPAGGVASVRAPDPVSASVTVIDSGHRRRLDVAVEVPRDELGAVATNEMWGEIYDRIAELILAHRTTLVFVNTRRLCERVAHHLEERLGDEAVLAHHGSLSRRIRQDAERRLKSGELRAVVATASLELGIDVGTVDLVCQIGSPRSIAVALQRIGRSGHHVDAGDGAHVPRGRLFATTRDELVECAALVHAIRRGRLDHLEIPDWPLDVLAQQLVAACASETWAVDDLFALVRGAAPYAALPRPAFEAVVDMLSDGIATSRGRAGAYLHRDRVNGTVRGRRGARIAAITGGGAIPDNANYLVVAEPDQTTVGTVDEDFAVESLSGDIFLLGTTSWRIRRVESGRLRVEDAHGAAPSLPFWRGEAPGRTPELSEEVSRLRERIAEMAGAHRPGTGVGNGGLAGPPGGSGPFPAEAGTGGGGDGAGPSRGLGRESAEMGIGHGGGGLAASPGGSGPASAETETVPGGGGLAAPPGGSGPESATDGGDEGLNRAAAWLTEACGLDRAGAEQAAAYVRAGAAALGAVPADVTVVAERFFDEGGGMQLVVHAPFGARINRAWGLALRKRFCRSFNFELQAAATDNGIVISLAEQHSFPLEVIFRFLTVDTVEEVLTQAMLPSPMFGTRWRWNASRALAVLRFAGGRKVPPPIQRMRSDDLLASVFPDQVACQENLTGDIRIPDHPLVNETVRDCLHEAMDLDGLRALLAGIESGAVRTRAVDTAEPSPFSHEILNANPYAFLDDAPLEERRARAVQLRRTLGGDADGMGALDPAAIATVADESWPVVRDPDELHDALLTLVALPPAARWSAWLDALAASRRAGVLRVGGTRLWVPTERLGLVRRLYPGEAVDPRLPDVGPAGPTDRETAAAELLRGWLESTGPVTASGMAERLALPPPLVEAGLTRLEGEGQILRGRFTAATAGDGNGTEVEWCNRRVLARIHRLTIGSLRREIEPVSTADFVRFLLRWQHLAPGTQLHGADGLLQILKQLQGWEISGAALEREVVARRVASYDPELLDRLCLSGEVMWGRLSPHPAFESPASIRSAAADARVRPSGAPARPSGGQSGPAAAQSGLGASQFVSVGGRFKPSGGRSGPSTPPRTPLPAPAAGTPPSGVRSGSSDAPVGSAGGRSATPRARRGTAGARPARVRPTRVAPITLFLRADADWLLAAAGRGAGADDVALSHPAREVRGALKSRGASFLPELVRATGRLPSEVEDGLWELVAAGLVSADGYDNLRALVDPKRRRGEGRGRAARPRHAAGRWALLDTGEPAAPDPGTAAPDARPRAPDARRGGPAAKSPSSDADEEARRRHDEQVARFAGQLLNRWGVVCRDLAARETLAPPWRELLRALRRMEARGEIRGGRFVAGVVGEQFARPDAVELLRIVRREAAPPDPVRVSAADPLNLTGVLLPGPRVSALSGGTVELLPGAGAEPRESSVPGADAARTA